MLNAFISDSLAHPIGWALVHFIWQGALVAGTAALISRALDRSSPNIRYAVACLALLVMFFLPFTTAISELRAGVSRIDGREAPHLRAPAEATSLIPESARATGPLYPTFDLESWFPAAVVFWLAGVTILSVRTLTGWLLVQRMRRLGSDAGAEISAGAREVARRLRMTRPVRIMESSLVSAPTVIGAIRPLILWPAAVAGLSPENPATRSMWFPSNATIPVIPAQPSFHDPVTDSPPPTSR